MMEDRQKADKVGVALRVLAAVSAIVILFLEYFGYEAAVAINGYYFKDFSAHVGAFDIFLLVLSLYLLLVAAFGFWIPRRR